MRRLGERPRDDERGQAIVLVALFMIGLVAVVGLVADGGVVFAQRRDLQNVADAAAVAAAMQIDERAYRESGGATVVLDEAAARRVALEYLADENDLTYSVAVRPDRIEVAVAREAGTTFLRAVGFHSVSISAESYAGPRFGVASGNRP